MFKKIASVLLAGLCFMASQAFALAPATIADLTTGISFSDVGLGILAVAALMIAVYITVKAAKMIVHAVKSF